MADGTDDDPVVHEVDVYLSKSLATNLFVLQYPLRPEYMSYENVEHLGVRIKPEQKVVEIELGLNTNSQNYSKSKGEQIALNVEGRNKGSQGDAYFSSGIMDKQVLRSAPCPVDMNRYAVGLLNKNELHVTPLHAMVQMRPAFDYLDKADNRQKAEAVNKEAATGDSSQDEDDDVQQVTVKFARPESEEAKARRMASFEFIQRRLEDEPWCSLVYHGLDDESFLRSEMLLLYGVHGDEKHQQFHSNAEQYLKTLLPQPDSDQQVKLPVRDSILNRQQLKLMPLADAVRALLTKVKVVQFSKLMELLPEETDSQTALRHLQQVAVMVQGCWIVKSEVLYPKDTCSPHSGVSAEYLIRGRDFVMWKFTHSKYVVRKEVASGLPSEDVKDILEQMSRLRSSKGWEFVFDYDRDFVDRHPEVVQRQRLLWDAKYQALSRYFKLPKDADKKAREAEQALMKQCDDRPRRRRASSRSSPRKRTLSSRSMSDLSDMDFDTDTTVAKSNCDTHLLHSAEKLTTEPMEICNEEGPQLHQTKSSALSNGVALSTMDNGGEVNVESDLLKKELISFAHDILAKRPVLMFSELKREFYLKSSQVPQDHILSSGIADGMLEAAVVAAGGVQLNKPLTSHAKTEPLFAFLHQGNRMDKAREVLFSFLEFTHKLKSAPFIAKVKELCGDEYSDVELKKLLRDICESHNSTWYLKGTLPNS